MKLYSIKQNFPQEYYAIQKDELERLGQELGDDEIELQLVTQFFEFIDPETEEMVKTLGPLFHNQRFPIEGEATIALPDLMTDIWRALIWYSFGFDIYFIVRIVGKDHFTIEKREAEKGGWPPHWGEDDWWQQSEEKFKKLNQGGDYLHHTAIVNLYKAHINRAGRIFDRQNNLSWDDWYTWYFRAIEQIALLAIEGREELPPKELMNRTRKEVNILLKGEDFGVDEIKQIRNYRNQIAHGFRIYLDHGFRDMTNRLKIAAEHVVEMTVKDVLDSSF